MVTFYDQSNGSSIYVHAVMSTSIMLITRSTMPRVDYNNRGSYWCRICHIRMNFFATLTQ